MSEFWRVVESNLPLIAAALSLGTFLGITLNAVMSMLNYWRTTEYNLPLVNVMQPPLHQDLPPLIDFEL